MPAMAEVSDCQTPPLHDEESPEIQLLLGKVKELEDSIREKNKLKADILNKIKEIRLKDANSKLDHGQSGIFDIILEKIEKDNLFGSDEDEIYFAAQAVRQEVNFEGIRERQAAYEKRFNGRDLRHLYTLPNLTTEEKEELLAHMFPCFPKYELEDYVIDEKPEVELQKIEKSDPRFYNDYFVYEEEPMELMGYLDDTVAVKNVPIDTTVFHIAESLMDCGEVIGIREERGKNSQTGKKCKIVFVTFEDSAAAKRALLKESPLVDGRLVEITTTQSASAWLMPNEVRTISSVESALEKYKELMEKYQKKSSGVEDAECASSTININKK